MSRISKSRRLYEKSEAALLSAIEIYNKPDFKYREETFAILCLNAWELLLKARLLHLNANKLNSLYIYDGTRIKKNRANNPMTHELRAIIIKLGADTTNRVPDPIVKNLEALTEIRDNAIHFFNTTHDLNKRVLEIGTAAVKNFVELASRWFQIDLTQYNLFLMPIGFLPINAQAIPVSATERNLIVFLNEVADAAATTTVGADFHASLSVNISFQRTPVQATNTIAVRTTNDPNAPALFVTEENIRQTYPWDYQELTDRLRARYEKFKIDVNYHARRKAFEAEARFCSTRLLDPAKPSGAKKRYYSPNIVKEFDKLYVLKPNLFPETQTQAPPAVQE